MFHVMGFIDAPSRDAKKEINILLIYRSELAIMHTEIQNPEMFDILILSWLYLT